jgi:hypothetical protein
MHRFKPQSRRLVFFAAVVKFCWITAFLLAFSQQGLRMSSSTCYSHNFHAFGKWVAKWHFVHVVPGSIPGASSCLHVAGQWIAAFLCSQQDRCFVIELMLHSQNPHAFGKWVAEWYRVHVVPGSIPGASGYVFVAGQRLFASPAACALPWDLPCTFGPAVRSAVGSHRGFRTVRSIFVPEVHRGSVVVNLQWKQGMDHALWLQGNELL